MRCIMCGDQPGVNCVWCSDRLAVVRPEPAGPSLEKAIHDAFRNVSITAYEGVGSITALSVQALAKALAEAVELEIERRIAARNDADV